VNCWGKLVTGVGAGLGKGDAVIVVGYVYTSEYEDREGVRRSSVEVRATSVGPDLARCIARIETRRHPGTSDDGQAAADSVNEGTGGDDKTSDDDEAVDGDAAVDEKAPPLSANPAEAALAGPPDVATPTMVREQHQRLAFCRKGNTTAWP